MSQTATVKVYAPCHCDPCKEGQQWFRCRGSISEGPIAEYDCALFDGMRNVPHPAAIAQIEKENPGAMLLYLRVGAEFDRLLAGYRQKLKA